MAGRAQRKHDKIIFCQFPSDQYFKILEQLPDIVYIIDPKGRFQYLNPAVRIIGYEPVELIGRHFWRIIHPGDRKRISREFVLPPIKGKVTGVVNAPKLFDERRTGIRQTRNLEIRLIPKKDFHKLRPSAEMIGSIIAWGNVSASGRYEDRRNVDSKTFQGSIGVIRDITERKTAEAHLRDQENRFRLLVDSINDGLMQVDNQDRVLFVNDNLCRMTGYTREELAGEIAYRMLFDPPEQAIIKKKNTQRLRKISDKYEIRMKKKNGGYSWIQISGSPVIDDRGRAMGSIGIFSDMSKRKLAERQLHFQADMLSHVSDAIITTDSIFKIRTWNLAAEKMFAIKAHEAIGKSFDKLILAQNSGKTEQISLKKIMKTDQWFEEIAFTRKDGKDLHIQISLTLIRDPKAGYSGIVAIIRDITKRKRAEEALKRKEEDYRTLAENLPDLIARFDRQLRHIYVNPAAARSGRLSASEYIGKTIYESGVPKLTARTWEQRIKRVLGTGQISEVVDTFTTPDGIRYFNTRFIPELAPDGSVQSVLSIARDITERKRTEEQIERLSRFPSENTNPVLRVSAQGTMEYANAASNALLPALGTEIDGTVSAEWKMRIRETLAKRHPVDIELQVKDRTFSVTLAPVVDYGYVNLYAKDISGRKRAEEALQSEKDFAETIIKTAQTIVLILDIWGRIVRFNPFMEELSGYALAEVRGKDWFSTFLPEGDRERIRNLFRKAINNIPTRGNVNPIVTKNGSEREIEWYDKTLRDAHGRVVGLLVIGHDITERKRIEEALKTSEERYRILVEMANDAIIVAQDDRLKFVNNQAVKLLNYSRESLLTRPFTDFIHPDDRDLVVTRYQKRLRNKRVPWLYPFRVINRKGESRWVEISSVLISWEGRPATLSFLADISERKKIEGTIARRLEVERILAMASEMVVKTSDLNLAIIRILALLGKALNDDWLGIFQLRDDRITLDNVHEWYKPGMKSLKPALQGITHKTHPWDFRKLISGQTIYSRTGNLPSASKSIGFYRKHGFKTILIIPIFYETRFFGSFDVFSKTEKRIWDDEDIRLLKTLGGIIATGVRKQQIQIKFNQVHDELMKERHKMITLTKRTIDTQEKERFYLASEIHDNLLQELAGMLYFVKNIDVRNVDPKLLGKRATLIEYIKSIIDRGRGLIRHIEPLEDPHINLIQGIRKSFDLRFSKTGVALYFNHPPKLPEISFFLKTNILRIVQEALMNIYKHARATAVSVMLTTYRNQIVIKIKDNGAGFSTSIIDRGKIVHYGLLSVQERAKLVGGTLSIVSKPGSGTIITAEIPLK